jgi:hypothetical protein
MEQVIKNFCFRINILYIYLLILYNLLWLHIRVICLFNCHNCHEILIFLGFLMVVGGVINILECTYSNNIINLRTHSFIFTPKAFMRSCQILTILASHFLKYWHTLHTKLFEKVHLNHCHFSCYSLSYPWKNIYYLFDFHL